MVIISLRYGNAYKELKKFVTMKNGNQLSNQWTAFVRPAKQSVKMDKLIKNVRYKLHPTFSQPIRDVTKPNSKGSFELTATAWGYFEIEITITL